jgi:hypothetical protein
MCSPIVYSYYCYYTFINLYVGFPFFYACSFICYNFVSNGRSHYYPGSGCLRCKGVDFQIIYTLYIYIYIVHFNAYPVKFCPSTQRFFLALQTDWKNSQGTFPSSGFRRFPTWIIGLPSLPPPPQDWWPCENPISVKRSFISLSENLPLSLPFFQKPKAKSSIL